MTVRIEDPRWKVRLSVPRRGGWSEWGAVSGSFDQRLADEATGAVISASVESQVRRGRDYVRVMIAVTVDAPDVAEALDAAWWSFRQAVADDTEGWDLAAAMAEVRPGRQ